jgi:hypothetical protein
VPYDACISATSCGIYYYMANWYFLVASNSLSGNNLWGKYLLCALRHQFADKPAQDYVP